MKTTPSHKNAEDGPMKPQATETDLLAYLNRPDCVARDEAQIHR